MNKAFKVIWSEARNAYVVVSEMAKSHGTKSCSTKKLLAMLIAAGIMTCASAAPVMAKDWDDAKKIEIGNEADADGDFSVAIGDHAEVDDHATNSVAIGHDAKVNKSIASSVALGANSVADRNNVVSVGSSDLNRQIINVAAGSADTDAVNVGQLKDVETQVGSNTTRIENVETQVQSNTTAIGNLDQKLNVVEATANKGWKLSTNGDKKSASKVKPGKTVDFSGDKNISVSHEGTNVKVELNKKIELDSVKTDQTVMNKDGLKVGDKVSVTATAVTAGKTSISDKGVKVGNKTYISDKGLNANNKKVTNVKDGKVEKDSKDAINGGQLYKTNKKVAALKKRVTQNEADIATNKADIATNKADIATNKADIAQNKADIATNRNRINQLGSRVNKVGAGAAALAALHPMDFDPDDKWSFAAGMGNYAGQNAAAIGAFYRPDEKVMFSVGGTVGNGENMVNAGISFALDRTNHVSNSRTAMAREILDLRAEVAELKAMVAKGGLGSIAEDKMKIFPDVAENHWAYEYIGKLAAAGIIEGYPDGNFGGDRMMSRYEFAAMLYRAMQNGVQLDSKIINEFAPEMGRIRVDRISGEDGDRDKIERVRVNAVKGERDHYGNKIAKAEAKAK